MRSQEQERILILEDRKTCLVCGGPAGSFSRVVPYMCRECYALLSPRQLQELQAIRKQGLPRSVGALVLIVVAMIFFIMNFFISFPLHFVVSFIGLGLILASNAVNMGTVNSLKPGYRGFALNIAQQKGNPPIGNPVLPVSTIGWIVAQQSQARAEGRPLPSWEELSLRYIEEFGKGPTASQMERLFSTWQKIKEKKQVSPADTPAGGP